MVLLFEAHYSLLPSADIIIELSSLSTLNFM